MYAIKEAIIAKEHAKAGLDAAIFYIDIRSYGKDFERYYNRAREQAGVRFVKSRIAGVTPVEGTGNLVIGYADEAGRRVQEEFDLVVLSVGLEASREGLELAKRLGVEISPHGFTAAGSFEPVRTSRPGIFACGVFQGPKDIPQSVIEASACAAAAEGVLASARGTLTRTKEMPAEQNVRGGLAYLRWLLQRFDGDVALASAAYNAGEGAVEKHGGVPPFAETRDYVQRILHFYRSPVHARPGAM
jgi:heterodisulfide reductase subunit A